MNPQPIAGVLLVFLAASARAEGPSGQARAQNPASPAPAASTITADPSRVDAKTIKVAQAASHQIFTANMNEYFGTTFNKGAFLGAVTVDDAKIVLEKMRQKVSEATNEKYKTIVLETVSKISDSLKTDDDYKSCKPELDALPQMLSAQLAIDQFREKIAGRDMTAQERATKEELDKQYMALMPRRPGPKGEAVPPKSAGGLSDSEMMSAMHGGGHALGVASPQTMAMGGDGAAPKAAKQPLSIMNEFHDIYHSATEQWNAAHPSAPTPPAGGPGGQPGPGGSASGQPGTANGGVGPNGTPPAPDLPGYPPPDHIDGMITEAPDRSDNWKLRSDYRLRTGDYAGAASDAEKAVSLGGGAPARVNLGQAKLELKDYSGAAEQAREALKLEPENQAAQALLHFSEGRTTAAGGMPSSASAGLAAGSPGGAASSAEAAAKRAAFLNQASAAAKGMSSAQAQKAAENAIRLGDPASAIVYMTRAIEADPNNLGLLNRRAMYYVKNGDYSNAMADAKAGLDKAPGNSAFLHTLAMAQVRGKDYRDALNSSKELLALNSADANAYALLAHAEGGLGDKAAMLRDIGRAAELDKSYADAAAQAAAVQIPSDKDILFLFPGETAPGAAAPPAAGAGKTRTFGLLAGVAALGGLLLALGLLKAVLAPLKEGMTSVFTRAAAAPPLAASGGVSAPSVGGLPGLIRGQYELLRQIGQGGMGTVFEGTDRSLGRRVAIKKMRDEIRGDARERARFVIEAKTVAALHHPNVVDIYAIAEDGEDVYLIFEYVDGKTVHDLVRAQGRLTSAEVLRITRASAEALGYAHSKGVIHRDMKPSNVMLDGAGRVKVMDFGIARMAKDAMTRYSMTNTVVGTPPYMAPEQEQGHVRRESDLYALAVCAYEMMTGRLPFIGIGAGMLMNKINMSFIPPSRAAAGLPEAVDEVFSKAFQADPDKRYRTPKEFADALEAVLPAGARV